MGFLEPCFQGCVAGSWTIIFEYTPVFSGIRLSRAFVFMCWWLLIVLFLQIINETKQNFFKLINYWTTWLHVPWIYLLHNSRLLQNVHSKGTLFLFFWNIIPQIKTSSRHCFVPVPRKDLEFKYHIPWSFLCLVCWYWWNSSSSPFIFFPYLQISIFLHVVCYQQTLINNYAPTVCYFFNFHFIV